MADSPRYHEWCTLRYLSRKQSFYSQWTRGATQGYDFELVHGTEMPKRDLDELSVRQITATRVSRVSLGIEIRQTKTNRAIWVSRLLHFNTKSLSCANTAEYLDWEPEDASVSSQDVLCRAIYILKGWGTLDVVSMCTNGWCRARRKIQHLFVFNNLWNGLLRKSIRLLCIHCMY